MNPGRDISGGRFGRLLALSKGENTKNGFKWHVRCDCGTEKQVLKAHLMKGNIRSCGCLQRETTAKTGKATRRHGHSRARGGPSPTYGTWRAMLQRCESPQHRTFQRYGAIGIRVCREWIESFEAFLADMGERPSGTTIDRIDNSKGYEPSNCRWATAREQQANRSIAKLQPYEMDQVVWLANLGYPKGEIAGFYGVTKSRVYKLQQASRRKDAQ
jgi:hypothetical protein